MGDFFALKQKNDDAISKKNFLYVLEHKLI